ncbi:hypothetical protein Y1Q_0004760 [Alligator mississippiensis]|uniref:Uncharacterized protein n=1 Tax=Alligator mississippiensis TaxID=8496 RepID=A0A151NLG4_ALLMI|nr:hypothetical protein Y1Q_0004760 [Alligator mississippiensis]
MGAGQSWRCALPPTTRLSSMGLAQLNRQQPSSEREGAFTCESCLRTSAACFDTQGLPDFRNLPACFHKVSASAFPDGISFCI